MTTPDRSIAGAALAPPSASNSARRRLAWPRLHRSTWVALVAALAAFGYLAGAGEVLDDDPAGDYEVYEHGWRWTFGYRFFWHDSKPMPPVTHTFSAYDGARLAADSAAVLGLAVVAAALWELRRRRRSRAWQFSLREALLLTTLVAVALSWWRWHRAIAVEEDRLFELGYRQRSISGAFVAFGRSFPGVQAPEAEQSDEEKAAIAEANAAQAAEEDAVRAALKQPRQPLVFRQWRRTEPRWLRRLVPRQWLGDFTHISACQLGDMRAFDSNGKLVDTETVDERFAERLKETWRSLPYCTAVRFEYKSVPVEAVAALAELPHVEFVSIDGAWLPRSALSPWKNCDRLRRLQAKGLEWAGDDALPPVRPFRRLEELDLSNGALRDPDVAGLRTLRGLKRLRLDNTHISGEGLEHLASLENLRSLSLARNILDSKGVAALSRLKQLEELDLHDTALPAEALPLLLGMKNLRSLRLTPGKLYYEGAVEIDDFALLPPRDPATGEPLDEHPIHRASPTQFQIIDALVHQNPADFALRDDAEPAEDESDDDRHAAIPDWVHDWLTRHAGDMGELLQRNLHGGGMGFM